ncbi:MAG: MMPL family transporter [Cellvibrionales bacterium]|nr:MMPL family transporter [Cellvibrionales bacterium]
MSWITTYCGWISAQAKWILLGLLAITLALASQLAYFTINPSPYFLSDTHPSRVIDKATKAAFTHTGEIAFIHLTASSGDIFNPSSLSTVVDLTRRISKLDLLAPSDEKKLRALSLSPEDKTSLTNLLSNGLGPEDITQIKALKPTKKSDQRYVNDLLSRMAPVRKVRSMASMEDLQVYIEEGEEILDTFALMETVPTTDDAMTTLKKKVVGNPLFQNILISEPVNGKVEATSLQVELAIDEKDSPNMIAMYDALNDLLTTTNTDDSLYLAGAPMVTAQTAFEMASNNQQLMPIVILIVLVILLLSFRSATGVLIPLFIAIMTTLWTMSIMAMFRIPQNIITTALPVFIISIAIADAIHFLSGYYQARSTTTADKAITKTFNELFSPLLITTVTTIIGFLAVSNTSIIYMQEFGWFVAIGIAIAFFLTVSLMPALLVMVDRRSTSGLINQSSTNTRIGQIAEKIIGQINQQKTLSLSIFVIFALGASFGIRHLTVDNKVIGNFAPHAPIRIADEKINAHFGGTTPLSLVFSSDTPYRFNDPEIITLLDQLSDHLKASPEVGYTLSLADYVKRSYQLNEAADFTLPDNPSSELISQYLFLYENGEKQDIRDLVNLGYDQTRIIVLLNDDRTSNIDKVLAQIDSFLADKLPEDITYIPSGFAELLSKSTQEIVIDQFNNNFIAVACIFVVLLLLLRSFVLACISIVPLMLTVYFIFSLMGAFNIPLDIGTALISCITFGVGIDYAIHFIVLLKQASEHATSLLDAVKKTARKVSGPILINSVSLAAGLLVTVTTDYKPIIYLGLIIATAMIICALITLVLLPLLVLILKPNVLKPKILNTHVSPAVMEK